jgi:tetratricopeptide (TPR) repeat protein
MKTVLPFIIIFYSLTATAQATINNDCYAAARNQAGSSQYSLAIATADSCLQKDSNDAALLNLVGCATIYRSSLNDEANNKLAITFLSKAIKIDPANAMYYSNRGWSWQMLDKYSAAMKDFRKALSLDSNNVELYGHVLRVLWLQNKNKEAMSFAGEVISKFPEDGYAWYVRGQLKRDYLHQYVEGNKDVKKGEQLGWRQGMQLYY